MAETSNVGRTGNTLRLVVGCVSIAAPALHSLSDVLEWHNGFSPLQLWLNYAAFVPMPWLLLGIYAVLAPRLGAAGLVGALLYGVAFVYFGHTALYAIAERIPTYEALWDRLGPLYTAHGALMVLGGLLFATAARRAPALPRLAVAAFAAGLIMNLALALVGAPDILQTLGTALRNLGLIAIGFALLRPSVESERRC